MTRPDSNPCTSDIEKVRLAVMASMVATGKSGYTHDDFDEAMAALGRIGKRLSDSNPCKRPKTWQEAKEEVFCHVYGHYWDLNRKCMTCGKTRPDSNWETRLNDPARGEGIQVWRFLGLHVPSRAGCYPGGER